MSAWINVRTRMPEENQFVLVFHDENREYYDHPISTAQYIGKDRFQVDHFCESAFLNKISFWMPLPDAPKAESAD